jgi:hypothetical protein
LGLRKSFSKAAPFQRLVNIPFPSVKPSRLDFTSSLSLI